MNTLEANTRNTKTKGDVRSLRLNGNVPAIIYGGSGQNEKISVSKKILKSLLANEGFLSSVITLNVDGKNQNVLPREIDYNVLSDEPTHVDFLRVVAGVKIRIEIPVQFINHEKSPGLKRGGVLNIVRRKIELKCPSEKIPESIVIDLDKIDIGESFKISSVKLEEGVTPSSNLIEDILKLSPISIPSRFITMASGIFSLGHFNSIFLLTIFNTPPLFKPGDVSWLMNCTGTSILIFTPGTTLRKSIWVGSSDITL